MQYRRMLALAAIATLLVVLAGCGGSGGGRRGPVEVASVQISVIWPETAGPVDTQLIPDASTSIKIEIFEQPPAGSLLGDAIINKPQTTAVINNIPVGDVRVCCNAYPLPNAVGVAQATAEELRTVVSGGPNTFTITMASTITNVVIAPVSPQVQEGGGTQTLTATAKDASNNTVMVALGAWTWNIQGLWMWPPGAPASVDASTGVLTGVHDGTCTVRAVESESGVSGTASVQVTDVIYVNTTTWNAGGQIDYPRGLGLRSSNSDVILADTSNERVQGFTSSGAHLWTKGNSGFTACNNGEFDYPEDCAVYGSFAYVIDDDHHRVQKLSVSTGGYVRKWPDIGCVSGNGNGEFNSPGGIGARGSYVYVADTSNHRIQQFTTLGVFQAAWGSGPGTGNTEFNNPYDVAIDSEGNMYVADFNNHRIVKRDSSGSYVRKWGSNGAADGQFNFPYHLAVDARDNIYVTDKNNHRIQKFTANGVHLKTFGSGPGGGVGQFQYPAGIDVAPDGKVYISDSGNDRVCVWTPIPPP